MPAIACPHCGAIYNVQPQMLGKKAKCAASDCGKSFEIPIVAFQPPERVLGLSDVEIIEDTSIRGGFTAATAMKLGMVLSVVAWPVLAVCLTMAFASTTMRSSQKVQFGYIIGTEVVSAESIVISSACAAAGVSTVICGFLCLAFAVLWFFCRDFEKR